MYRVSLVYKSISRSVSDNISMYTLVDGSGQQLRYQLVQ